MAERSERARVKPRAGRVSLLYIRSRAHCPLCRVGARVGEHLRINSWESDQDESPTCTGFVREEMRGTPVISPDSPLPGSAKRRRPHKVDHLCASVTLCLTSYPQRLVLQGRLTGEASSNSRFVPTRHAVHLSIPASRAPRAGTRCVCSGPLPRSGNVARHGILAHCSSLPTGCVAS